MNTELTFKMVQGFYIKSQEECSKSDSNIKAWSWEKIFAKIVWDAAYQQGLDDGYERALAKYEG